MDGPNHNCIVWNVRGINAGNRGVVVRALVEDNLASIVCLVESKLALVDRYTVLSLLGSKFSSFAALPAANTSGGIIVACWDGRGHVSLL